MKSLLLILLLIPLLVACSSSSDSGIRKAPDKAPDKSPGNVMERILKTGKIRSSYLVYSSYFQKDANTKKLSGIFHDVMEEIGKNAGLQIEWTEEVGYENIFPGLESNRYDVFAAGLWPNASRAKAATFTIPIFYSAITPWCRPDDHRFESDLSKIDSPNIRIATIDGAMEDLIAQTDFPKSKRISLPELSSFSQNLLNVANKKADVTFAEPMVVNEFLVTNPNALRQIAADKPLRIFGNSLVIKRGEVELKEFLDAALKELIDSGRISKILSKYDSGGKNFYPLSRPYQMP